MDTVSFVFILGMLYLMLLVLMPPIVVPFTGLPVHRFILATIIVVYIAVWLLDYYFLRPANPGNMQHIEFSVMHFIQIGAVCSVLLVLWWD